MKKYLMSMLALIICMGMAQAKPVSVSQAKFLGQQFVQANFDQTRSSGELTLVYTGTTQKGIEGCYVFNVGETGFVIMSADDNFRPVIGYSDEGVFDVNNIPPAMEFYLNSILEARSHYNGNVVNPKVATEWSSLAKNGTLFSRNGGKGREFLVKTRWNQNPAPYNSMCPEDPQSPNAGYHAYVGCVATAMSQIMKYWNYPTQGQGSHSYYHPKYGQQSANFGATTYDWDHMLNSYSSGNYSPEEGTAVATLCYHCGVAVNMNYGGDVEEGSGANSESVPGAISNYFRYSGAATVINKSNPTTWMNILKEAFDMGWPMYYAGVVSGEPYGHAFICDGYDDNDYFHFNWGWGGSGDNWFLIDEMEYNSQNKIVNNFVPADIYNATAQAPTNLNVVPAADNSLSTTLSWTNPSKTLNNSNLTTISQIVVTRDGEVVYTEDNVTPGAAMTVVDNTVPRYDAFRYEVYAVVNGAHGKVARQSAVSVGPTCGWNVIISQASFTGFKGGAIHVYNSAGTEVASVTTASSNVQTIPVDVPLGHVSFGWSAPTQSGDFDMAFTIKDSQNNVIYTYSGSSANMAEGVFCETNNGCGSQPGTGVPTNVVAITDEDNPNSIHVSWDAIPGANGYGYTVYRDGVMYRLIPEGTSFFDENTPVGGHCYYVGYLYDGGENGEYSNESCATSGDCYGPTNIDYETTGNANKIKLKWEKPDPAEGLSGYYLFRKYTGLNDDEEGEYTRIKLLGANATSYTDNTANTEGHYYYKLYATYQSLGECISVPANWIHDNNQFYLHVYYSTTGVEEEEISQVVVFPNPAKNQFSVEGQGLTHVTVYNMLGQMVYDSDCDGDTKVVNMSQNESGLYVVRVSTVDGEYTKRITVVK